MADTIAYRVGRALRGLRAERGKRQTEAAKSIGISALTLRNVELGHSAPGHTWQRIADHYGISARELLERAARIPEPEEGR
jgi:DNA-binding XRE family transcriptional regulator